MAEVRFEGLTKRFGNTEVIRPMDLTIRDGEFFTLVGPSGCGKSTLLHMVAGLESPTSGEIYFDGQPVGPLAPKDRDVAVVFQSYALYPHMTIYDNLAFPLRMKKWRPAETDRQVRKTADLLGLNAVINRKPRELSGGQRQRVALGRAIVRQPRLFLLDEPLSNLDAQLRVEMRAELKKLHQALKVTMIYVTHDQAEAMTLSDRMAVLHEGAIQQCGSPREVYERPTNRFVAGFIGSPPMNLLSGTLRPGPPHSVGVGADGWYDLSREVFERLREAGSMDRIIMGIRPESIGLSKGAGTDGRTARISVVEPMGSEVWVELVWGDQKLHARAPADFEAAAGAPVHLEIEAGRIHFFDAGTGHKIL